MCGVRRVGRRKRKNMRKLFVMLVFQPIQYLRKRRIEKDNRELMLFVTGNCWSWSTLTSSGKGFDLPAIEYVSFARPTMSYGLFCSAIRAWIKTGTR